MDREIPKEVRDKERKKKFIKYGAIGVAAVRIPFSVCTVFPPF